MGNLSPWLDIGLSHYQLLPSAVGDEGPTLHSVYCGVGRSEVCEKGREKTALANDRQEV